MEAVVDLFETFEVWKCGRRVFHSRTFSTFSARVSLAKVVAGPNHLIGLLLLSWITSTGAEFIYICGIINSAAIGGDMLPFSLLVLCSMSSSGNMGNFTAFTGFFFLYFAS